MQYYRDLKHKIQVKESSLKALVGVFWSVGIGQDIIDRNELNIIASDPDNEFVYFVANFSDLSSIENNVARTTCQGKLLQKSVRYVNKAFEFFKQKQDLE